MLKEKKHRKLIIITTLVLMMITMTVPVTAMDFHVKPEFPENQRQNDSTFFDLVVTPGQEQDLIFIISNVSDHDIAVVVEAITASTDRNGQINYATGGEMDESLKYFFENLVSLPQRNYEVPAQSSIEVMMNLRAPVEPFDGAILGSIRVLRDATAEEHDATGTPVSKFASVNAVRLVNREDAEDIPVNLALGEISAGLVGDKTSIVVPIRNTQPRIVQGASANAQIYPRGGNQPILEYSIDGLDFAPNAIFPLTIIDEEGNGITQGEYSVVIEIEHNGQFWNFKQDLRTTTQSAAEENKSTQNGIVRQVMQTMPPWQWLAIAAVAIIIIVIVIMVIIITRRRSAFPRF